jgi:hypothetical protein
MAGILKGDIHWADLNPVIGGEQDGFLAVLIPASCKALRDLREILDESPDTTWNCRKIYWEIACRRKSWYSQKDEPTIGVELIGRRDCEV